MFISRISAETHQVSRAEVRVMRQRTSPRQRSRSANECDSVANSREVPADLTLFWWQRL